MNKSQQTGLGARVIRLAREFSSTPGARYRADGDWSGQQFREDILEPAYREAARTSGKVVVDLDECEGFATSFLEEAFGGLARKLGSSDRVLNTVAVTSSDEPGLVADVEYYIQHALDEDH
ncbi:MAG: STAS-like domain-containing protein [Pseudomonadota bacterium]|nr:STAS-like domain-containing protein [Pseudomonadota bacterium]